MAQEWATNSGVSDGTNPNGAITRELEHKLTDWTETYFRIPSEAEIELPQ